MDEYFITTVFFTLLFVIDPFGLIPVFIVYLSEYERRQRALIILKVTSIAIFVSLFFITLGKYLLQYLSISGGSFLVAGGILLFLISMEMLRGQPSKIKMLDRKSGETADEDHTDHTVFPLAIPMLCGPGAIAALLMFSSQTAGDLQKKIMLILITVGVFLLAAVIMFFSGKIGRLFGHTGISILQRLIGLILAALAIQFIRNGLVALKIIA